MSSSTLDNKIDIFDVKKTPEIYPMTSIHETFEYFHDKMNQLNKRAYDNSAMMQRLAEQVQQLSTRIHKGKASTQQEEPTVDDLCAAPPQPEPKAPVPAEKPILTLGTLEKAAGRAMSTTGVVPPS